jgi:hypothetical protein
VIMKAFFAYVVLVACAVILLCSSLSYAEARIDSRFAVCGGRPGDQRLLDLVGANWHLNWHPDLAIRFTDPDYSFVRMYWRTTAGEYTDEEIQAWARNTREKLGPDATIVWLASNEPNVRGQANQTPEEFAPGYYQYHKNIKIGDPDALVLGPGLMDWTFKSSTVFMTGKEWYEEFREIWANIPEYAEYSMSIQSNPYPPMDGFNIHTYDVRGIDGTPWVEPDWRYLKSETLACYADLQTYPETQGLKIWNTEYGSLRAQSITESADTLAGIGLWFREQPFMERWFFFILRVVDDTWQNTILVNNDGTINALGKAHYALSTMGDAEIFNIPYHGDYSDGVEYVRPGTKRIVNMPIKYGVGIKFQEEHNRQYGAGTLGLTYTMEKPIKRVTFNYRIVRFLPFYQLELDIPGDPGVWSSIDVVGDGWGEIEVDEWVDIDLSEYDTNELSIVLRCTADHSVFGAPAFIQVTNITFWFCRL